MELLDIFNLSTVENLAATNDSVTMFLLDGRNDSDPGNPSFNVLDGLGTWLLALTSKEISVSSVAVGEIVALGSDCIFWE